jgi:hypothetical protein
MNMDTPHCVVWVDVHRLYSGKEEKENKYFESYNKTCCADLLNKQMNTWSIN